MLVKELPLHSYLLLAFPAIYPASCWREIDYLIKKKKCTWE